MRTRRNGFRIFLVIVAAAKALPAQSLSQTSVVRFHIIDEQQHPVPGALISISMRDDTIRWSAQTNDDGQQTVALPRRGEYDYRVRRIGFAPSVGVLRLSGNGSPTVTVTLARATFQLDTVRTDARNRLRDYRIGADEIARDHRDLDSYDVLMHLRPQMLGDVGRLCQYTQYLWVNGRRIPLAPWEHVVPVQPADGAGRATRRAPFPMSHSPPDSPLTRIKPQHIAEIWYVDCWAKSTIPGGYGNNALFVTLKAGIGFDVRKGSFVADSALARNAGVNP
jgi:hypothetical protein